MRGCRRRLGAHRLGSFTERGFAGEKLHVWLLGSPN
jgi:hypothetical protein